MTTISLNRTERVQFALGGEVRLMRRLWSGEATENLTLAVDTNLPGATL